MGTVFKLIGLAVSVALLTVLMVFGFIWLIGMLGIVMAVFAVAWAAGTPFKVKQNGVVIGHIRRTKFYPLQK